MTTDSAYTPMRPLVMDFRSDTRASNIGDQFLFGPAILVNPVTQPGATSRIVYLPQAMWYDFWTGASKSGGQEIVAAAPLHQMPLYVRAGSILPMGPDLEYSNQSAADPLELRIYRGANARFTLYEDENDNYNYERGAHATILFQWDEANKTLTVGERAGQFPGMLEKRTFHVVLVAEHHGDGIAPTAHPDKTVEYSGHQVSVAF